jgi:hypothetical protein
MDNSIFAPPKEAAMKSRSLFLLAPVMLLVPLRAHGHFKLLTPPDWIVTNADGDPQKMNPCGVAAGTATNIITKVKPGSKLMLKWTETVGHPGHYRIAMSADRTQLKEPMTTVVANDCKSAAIEATPTLPIIADGLFPHTAPQQGMTYTYEITVPNMKCDKCTIQVLEFMSSHPPPCYYHHCADIQITDDVGDAGTTPSADAGNRDATVVTMRDAATGGSSGTAGSGGGGAAGGSSGGTAGTTGTAGRTGSAGSTGTGTGGTGGTGGSDSGTMTTTKKHAASGGCALGAASPSAGVAVVAGLLLLAAARRRRR